MSADKPTTKKGRNFLGEIESKKSRLFRADRWELIKYNFAALNRAMESLEMFEEQVEYLEEVYKEYMLKGHASELDKYFPIRCVACIEGYVKLVYSYLIEYGTPFRENAKKFDKINFSIDTAISLELSSVCLGDFISHLLSANNFEDINKTLSTILDKDFAVLCRESFKTLHRQKGLFFKDDDTDFNDMMNVIQNMYKVRHIFCHEVGNVETSMFSKGLRLLSPRAYIDETWMFLSLIEKVIAEIAPPLEKDVK